MLLKNSLNADVRVFLRLGIVATSGWLARAAAAEARVAALEHRLEQMEQQVRLQKQRAMITNAATWTNEYHRSMVTGRCIP